MVQQKHEINLTDFLLTGTQSEVAKALDIGQSAVAQMIAAKRDIRIILDDAGKITRAYEVKHLGRKTSRAA